MKKRTKKERIRRRRRRRRNQIGKIERPAHYYGRHNYSKDVLPNANGTQIAAVHSRHRRQRRNGPVCCCMTLFAANALQCIFSGDEICPQ